MKGQSHWYDTAQEDQTRPGLRWAKFHKMVGQGLIPRVLLPGMKQGVHPRRDVDTLMFPVNEPVVLPFVRLEPFRVYFESIIMDPALPTSAQRFYASLMTYKTAELLLQPLNNSYQITGLYTVPSTLDGDRLVQKLGFRHMYTPVLVPERRAYEYLFQTEGL